MLFYSSKLFLTLQSQCWQMATLSFQVFKTKILERDAPLSLLSHIQPPRQFYSLYLQVPSRVQSLSLQHLFCQNSGTSPHDLFLGYFHS